MPQSGVDASNGKCGEGERVCHPPAANPNVIVQALNFGMGYMRIGSNYTPAGLLGSIANIVNKLF
jgi:hypothetical protein